MRYAPPSSLAPAGRLEICEATIAMVMRRLYPWTGPAGRVPHWIRNDAAINELLQTMEQCTDGVLRFIASHTTPPHQPDEVTLSQIDQQLSDLLEMAELFDRSLRQHVPSLPLSHPDRLPKTPATPRWNLEAPAYATATWPDDAASVLTDAAHATADVA